MLSVWWHVTVIYGWLPQREFEIPKQCVMWNRLMMRYISVAHVLVHSHLRLRCCHVKNAVLFASSWSALKYHQGLCPEREQSLSAWLTCAQMGLVTPDNTTSPSRWWMRYSRPRAPLVYSVLLSTVHPEMMFVFSLWKPRWIEASL